MTNKSKYISPFTDFGFKHIFGQSNNKEFLIDFLNALFKNDPDFEPIVDVLYLNEEEVKFHKHERGVIYDIKCTTSAGKHFIVEMQNSAQPYFINRSLYYWAKAVAPQGAKGERWMFDFSPVYIIAFMNFQHSGLDNKVISDIALCDVTSHKQISDKLRFIYIQLPLFKNAEEECKNEIDEWLFNLKNMETMDTLAFKTHKNLFDRLEKVTSYANLSESEKRKYDEDLKNFRDLDNTLYYREQIGIKKGIEKGIEKGRKEERAEIINTLLESGMDAQQISSLIKIPVGEIEHIISMQ